MTDDETIEFDRLKTARDSLLLTVANLRGQLETIAAHEREECIKAIEKILFELANQPIESAATKKLVIQSANIIIDGVIEAIRARSKHD